MEHSSLFDLITCLEYGIKAHICIVFLDKFGTFKTELPKKYVTHSKPFCKHNKSTPDGHSNCFKCRNITLKKAITEKKPFGGLCFNGIYEYCHPIIDNDSVIAVIFMGNILNETAEPYSEQINHFAHTFETNFDEEKCRQFCTVIENHIKLLIYEYSDIKSDYNSLVTNVINYIAETLQYNISVAHIADIFNYNEQYIGKLFKKHTGKTIKEYSNYERLKKSKELLKKTSLSVTEISIKTGFNNVTYFNRLFKRHFNLSPTEYRNSLTATDMINLQ